MKNRTAVFILIYFILTGIVSAQSKSNLDVFYKLIDSTLTFLPGELPSNSSLSLAPGNPNLLYNYIYSRLSTKYREIKINDKDFYLSYALEDLKLSYGEIFRKKFLGDYYINRNFNLKGNFIIPEKQIHRDFNLAYEDTVKLDDLKGLENEMHPFTRSEIPPEPLFQGIIEPIVAIGTAAAAVVLFFVLRSK